MHTRLLVYRLKTLQLTITTSRQGFMVINHMHTLTIVCYFTCAILCMLTTNLEVECPLALPNLNPRLTFSKHPEAVHYFYIANFGQFVRDF